MYPIDGLFTLRIDRNQRWGACVVLK